MKNFVRYVIPSMIVLSGIIGFGIAATTNLQTWQTTTGSRVANVTSDGSFNCNNALATATSASITGSSGTAAITSSKAVITSSGSITFSAVAEGTQYKQYVLGVSSLTTTGNVTWTYPVPFAIQPRLNNSNTASSSFLTMSTGTVGTITNGLTGGTLAASGSGTATTGIIVIDGQ